MKWMHGIALIVLLVLPASSALAQSADSGAVESYRRSELAATALAWIGPGVGHLYAGDQRRGETILVLGSLTIVALSWAMIDVARSFGCFVGDCSNAPPLWHAYAQGTLAAVGVGAWAFGVYDAHLAVRRQRKLRNRPRPPDRELSLIMSPALGLSGPAIGVSWTW